MGEGRAAVALQRAEQWIDVDLVAGRSQEAATAVVAQIVTMRGDRALEVGDVYPRNAGVQDGIPDLQRRGAELTPDERKADTRVGDADANAGVAAESAGAHRNRRVLK